MHEIKNAKLNEQLLLSEKEVQEYTSLGRNTARELMKEIGAVKKVGRRVLYYRPVIDAYFERCGKEA